MPYVSAQQPNGNGGIDVGEPFQQTPGCPPTHQIIVLSGA